MEIKIKNRDWVKNAAIVFLAVLLILTFFSNTFMNRSLAEVATAAVSDGSIVAKVRGTGTVKANGNHDVKATQTREIRSVMVKVGQEVKTGDTLFVLGSGDSEELEAAKETLKDLQYSYQKQAVNLPTFNTTSESVAVKEAQANLTAAETALSNAQKAYDTAKNTAVSQADKDKLAQAEKELADAEENLESVQKEYNEGLNMLNSKLVAWQNVVDSKIAESIKTETPQPSAASEEPDTGSTEENSEKSGGIAPLAAKSSSGRYINLSSNQVIVIPSKDYGDPSNSDSITIEQAINWRDATAKAVEDFKTTNQSVLDSAQAQVDAAQAKYDAANAAVDETLRLKTYSDALASAQAQYDSAAYALEIAQGTLDYTNSANQQTLASASIDLQQLADKIKTQQEKVKQLSGESGDEITANVNGTVTAISVSAGDTVTKDMVLCTIEVPDMGHTLSFSVTNEQAQRLRVGDTATVSNYYWGKEIVATLSSIVTDPKNPQTNKTLTFDLTGDVTSGSELTISVGQKSANYDTIVPNSSIRSDSNGQFVLAVESKSSPLGNRYVAKRVSVEVLAADDDNSAVVADLGWGDYVITTSSSPVKAGDQVRLTDS